MKAARKSMKTMVQVPIHIEALAEHEQSTSPIPTAISERLR